MQALSTKTVKEDMQLRIEQFAGQVVADLSAAMAGVMTNLGHKLGLYRAMATAQQDRQTVLLSSQYST